MLFVFDNETKQCTAIHINRDTMVDVHVLGVAGNKIDTLTRQIALAHTYGNGRDISCRNTANSVSSLLKGVKVNHYLSVMMDAVPIFNDLVGGVEVVVLHDFTGIDDTLVKGETVTLMGEQALRYVRTRNGLEDSTNSTRMERQQQYINALYQATQKCIADNDEFIVDASLTMSDYTVSDRSVTQLQALAEKFNQYEFLGIQGIAGESKMGEEYIEFYPDENALMELVVRLFYETVK
jgi:LCP family protein required for cell wall assembly